MHKLRLKIEKRLILFFLVLLFNVIYSGNVDAQTSKKITTVVIDPGHGGKDPGAIGRKSKEKDITLKVAKMTGDYIKQYCPDVKVVYTRTSDVSVSLLRRAQIANQNNADLFISIHCNANASASPQGVETFIMGEHRNAANLEVAKLENASILYEDNAEEDYGDFNPNSPEAYIMLSFFQSEYKNASLKLAEQIQNQLVNRVGRKDRGVQQAGFLVLYKTAMPSVLVEIGFISNPSEENFLISKDGQTYIASAFISIHCNANASASPQGVETFIMGEHRNAANLEVAKLENASILYEDNAEEDYGDFNPNSPEAYIMLSFFQSEYKNASLKLAEQIQNQLVNRVGRKDRGVQQAGFLVLYKTAMPSVLVEIGFISNPSEENFLISKDGQTYIASALFRAFRDYKKAYEKDNVVEGSVYEEKNNNDAQIASDVDKVVYKVQIDSRSRKLDNPAQHYNNLKNVDCYEHNGQFKYTAGHFYTKKEADDYCKSVRAKGYKDAFVISMKNGKRI